MAILNIIKISRKPKETKYGLKTSVGLKTKEYGDKWLNGWADDNNATWIEGTAVEATIEQNGDWLNFKAIPPSVAPYSVSVPKVAPRGNLGAKTPYVAPTKEVDWDAISRGKVRHGVALEAIKKDMVLDVKTDKWIKDWTNYIMSGELNLDNDLGINVNGIF